MIDSLLSKKATYLFMLLLLFFFLRENRMILKLPILLNFVIAILSFIIIVFVSVVTLEKKSNVRSRLLKVNFLGAIIMAFFLFIIIKLPMNYLIDFCSKKNGLKTEILNIDNFVTSRTNMVYFYFEGERYGLKYRNTLHIPREEIIKDYKIQLNYRESILGTYVIENYIITK